MANVVARDVDEELSLFLEMRRREKVQGVFSLSEPGTNSVEETTTESLESTTTRYVNLRSSAIEKFLDSENNKSDYEWLLAAPETGGEKEAQENSMVKLKQPKAARSTALKPRVENIQQEPVTLSVKASKKTTRLDSSTAVSKQSNTIAEPKTKSKPSRQATPTPRTTLSSTRPTNSARNSSPACRASSIKSNPRAAAFTRSSSVGKSVPTAAKSTSLTIRQIPARPVSASRGRVYSSGGRSSKISDDVNPVLMGTQMVERVVNMRKLPPPKHDDNNMNSGFGRTLSRSSLDMAMRHMVRFLIPLNIEANSAVTCKPFSVTSYKFSSSSVQNIKRSVPGSLRVTSNATNSMDKESSPSSYCPDMPAF
ncbi:hypothetical protein HID58_016214 [Brassica napus]|uniref:Uncharacterized protein n=1 Tax=Brassica napus TaxID=3708 RepID=A0ABQ8DN44_BRANA|nr:hypothetical protein HID58_016214 [Brassica napus]